MKGIIEQLKSSTLFYSLLIWFLLWFGSMVFDKYRETMTIEEKSGALQYARRQFLNQDRMREIEMKLEWFSDPIPQYFYLDSGIIEVMYSIREFKEFSGTIFRNLVESIDKFLKFSYYCHTYPDNLLMDNLNDIKKTILNQLHSLVFNIPSNNDVAEIKLHQATQAIHFILNFHIERVRVKNNDNYESVGANVRNKYLTKIKEEPFPLKSAGMAMNNLTQNEIY